MPGMMTGSEQRERQRGAEGAEGAVGALANGKEKARQAKAMASASAWRFQELNALLSWSFYCPVQPLKLQLRYVLLGHSPESTA